jgi:hypothetical protein
MKLTLLRFLLLAVYVYVSSVLSLNPSFGIVAWHGLVSLGVLLLLSPV